MKHWRKYRLRNQTEGDCQLISAVNAYYYLKDRRVSDARYKKLIDLCGCRYGSAVNIKKVWKQLQLIPFGKTISYQELAERVGDSKKARAVGNANGKNPIPIIVPCHRVIAKDGSLGGFGGGLPIKRYLLELERTV